MDLMQQLRALVTELESKRSERPKEKIAQSKCRKEKRRGIGDHLYNYESLFEFGLDAMGNTLPKGKRPRCGASTRVGGFCQARVVPGMRRCRMHGGLSTGPKSQEGRDRISRAQKERWRKWREQHSSRTPSPTALVLSLDDSN